MCIDAAHCELWVRDWPPVPVPPPPLALLMGIQSQDCAENPNWCRANQAEIPMCDRALLMSDALAHGPNGTALHFNGLRILRAAIVKLAALGLNKAERVVLTGFVHGGTAVFLHADRIGRWLRQLAPSLRVYKALPADGFHPKHNSVEFFPAAFPDNQTDVYSTVLQGVANVSNASAGMTAACKARHVGVEWNCLYVNETLADIVTPTFAVQQQASIFDTQCNIAAEVIAMSAGRDAILMVQCIAGRGQWHICFQYSERCSAAQLTGVVAPFQQQYVGGRLYTRRLSHATW